MLQASHIIILYATYDLGMKIILRVCENSLVVKQYLSI